MAMKLFFFVFFVLKANLKSTTDIENIIQERKNGKHNTRKKEVQ